MKKLLVAAVLIPSIVLAVQIKKPTDNPFYVYKDASTAMLNHYVPSGYMGDFGDIKINPRYEVSKGNTCLEVKYSAERKQDNGWAGVYFQDPANNWANMKGGFDLSNYSTLKFKAKGMKGGEVIDKFIFGGISDAQEEGDSDSQFLANVTLTKDWKDYEIDISKLNRSHIIGGFGWAANADNNPAGFDILLDEIRFEK